MSPELRARGLTQRQVQAAERREGISHPLLDVLDQQAPRIAELNITYDRFRVDIPSDNQTPQRFIRQNFGFLADAVEGAGEFSVAPLELVAVWSKAVDMLRGYQRYAFAEIIGTAYSIQGTINPGWRGFPRYYFEKGRFPTEVARDHVDLTHTQARLEEIYGNLNSLEYYVHGHKGSSMEYGSKLGKRISRGDQKAEVLLDRMITRGKARRSHILDILDNIQENFGNGLGPLRMDLAEEVEIARFRLLSRDELLEEVRQLNKYVSQPERQRRAIQAELRAYPTDVDGRRDTPWSRGSIYFHALQDLILAVESQEAEMEEDQIKGSQACFVKDLDQYLEGFPEGNDEIREVFESILNTGTTSYWSYSSLGTRKLYELFDALDVKVIRPWVRAESQSS